MHQATPRTLTDVIRRQPMFQAVGRVRGAGSMLSVNVPCSVGDVCQIESHNGSIQLAEVVAADDHDAKLLPLHPMNRLSAQTRVRAMGRGLAVPQGDQLLGRILGGCGRPIDGRGPLPQSTKWKTSDQLVPAPLSRPPIQQVLPTGIRAIDGVLTIGVGQRIGLFAGSGVGKSTLLGEIARQCHSDRNVVVLVGERGREVKPFVDDCLGPEGMERSVVVVTTSDQPPMMRVRSVETGIAIADGFRRDGHRVLLLLDSLTRLAMAQREVGLLLGEPPTSRGYTPSVFQLLATVLEQLGCSDRGSITAIATVLVDGDDMNDPVADSVRSIVDGHIVLDRQLAELDHYPAIDVSQSLSRVFNDITDPEHQKAARKLRAILATYKEAEDLIRAGAYEPGSSAEIDLARQLMPPLNRFLKQDLQQPCAFSETRNELLKLASQWTHN